MNCDLDGLIPAPIPHSSLADFVVRGKRGSYSVWDFCRACGERP
jgi:hypothetical protein